MELSSHLMTNLLPKDGELRLYQGFVPQKTSKEYLNHLLSEVPWEQKAIKLFGKSVLEPRLTNWQGNEGCNYRYSGVTAFAQAWTPTVFKLKSQVEKFTSLNFNSALLNYYRDGSDSMGLHADDEKELGANPCIASLSFGISRYIVFKHKTQKLKVKVELLPGSLLIMSSNTQHHWKHELPKSKLISKPRVNVTFRKIIMGYKIPK